MAVINRTAPIAFAAFDAQERQRQAERWGKYEASEAERESLDRRIAEEWERVVERREWAEAKRIGAIASRFPKRALEAARTADMGTSAIHQLAAWCAETDAGIVVISGPVGCGKTTAAAWWALQQSYAPDFLRAPEFAAMSRYDRDARDRWQRAAGLVLDDLGAEYSDSKGSFRVDLDELVDVYYGDKRTLVVTTNCTSDEFRARYGERVVDRLRESGTWLAVVGPSLRRRGDA